MYQYAPQAQDLAGFGRYGDSMLVHMQPQEVAGLEEIARSRGGSLTINPHTGLVEAWGIGDIFGSKGLVGKSWNAIGLGDAYSSLSKGVSSGLQSLTKTVAPYLPYILPFIPIPGIAGLSPLLTKALISATVAGLGKDGKNFDVKKGVTAGAMTYGLGSLGGGDATAADAGTATVGDAGTSAAIGSSADPTGLDISSVSQGPASVVSSGTSIPSGPVPAGQPAPVTNLDMAPGSVPAAPPGADAAAYGNLASATGERVINALTPTSATDALKMASYGTTAVGGIMGIQEQKRQREEAERILREQEKYTKEQVELAKSILARHPLNYSRASASDIASRGYAIGGIAGGRYLQGRGDGTSDSIPARINGRQEARLADGEFVIDARTVSEIGNGSSNAGAKKLYQMMDRVHAARRAAKRGKSSNADKYLPA